MIFEISLSYSFSMMSGISSAFQNLETILCIKIAWCSLLIIMFLFMQKLAYDICWYKKKSFESKFTRVAGNHCLDGLAIVR